MFGLYPVGVTILALVLAPLFYYIWPSFAERYRRGRYTRKEIRALRKAKSVDISELGKTDQV